MNNNTSIQENGQKVKFNKDRDSDIKDESHGDDKYKLSEPSDELLSDHSPINDVLSAGSGGNPGDLENSGNFPTLEQNEGKENEKNTYYFE